MGSIILLASGKGGCGKSTFAVNLGCVMASRGKTTLLLDMNIGLRSLDIYTGLQDNVVFDLGDFFKGDCKLQKAIIPDYLHPNLYLLSCPQIRGIESVTEQHIRWLTGQLSKSFDVVIVDAPLGIGNDFSKLVTSCDKALLLLTQDYVSLRNTEGISKRLENMGILEQYYAINRVNPTFWGREGVPDAEEIAKVMKSTLIGILPEDPVIHIGNNTGNPAASDKNSYIFKTFSDMVTKLLD